MRMTQATPPEVRFLAKVEVDSVSGCWQWRGAIRPNGYGYFKVNGGRVLAHRWAVEHWKGPIADGLVVDHLCRVPRCVNPDHLEAVTQRVNLLRAPTFQARNARKTHCAQGHEYTPENTYLHGSNGIVRRHCRACVRRRGAEWRAKKEKRLCL